MEHHNKGNRYAAKPEDEKALSTVVFRCRREDKARWVKAAQNENKKLTEWLIEAADEKEKGGKL